MSKQFSKMRLIAAPAAAVVAASVAVATGSGGTVQGLGTTSVKQSTATTQLPAQRGADTVAFASHSSSCNAEASYKVNKSAHTLTVWSSGHRRLCHGVYVGVGVYVFAKPNANFAAKGHPNTTPQNRAWARTVHYTGGKTVVVHYAVFCGDQTDFYASRHAIHYPAHITHYATRGHPNGEAPPIGTYLHGKGYSVIYPIVNCQLKPKVKVNCPANCAGVATATVTVPAIAGPRSWKKVVNTYVSGKLVRHATVWANKLYVYPVRAADRSHLAISVYIVDNKAKHQVSYFTIYCATLGTPVPPKALPVPCGCSTASYVFAASKDTSGGRDHQWAQVYDNGSLAKTLQPGQSVTLKANPGHLFTEWLYSQSGPSKKQVKSPYVVGA